MATKLCTDVQCNFTFFIKETTGTLVIQDHRMSDPRVPGHLFSLSVVRAGPAVYGAFDGSWKPLLPIFEGPSLMKHQIVTEYLEYLYGKQNMCLN
jgi:hypothetical protein